MLHVLINEGCWPELYCWDALTNEVLLLFLTILRKYTFLLKTLFYTNISTFSILVSISNSYSTLKEVHVPLRIIVVISPDTTFRRISLHLTKIEWNKHSSSNNNWYKLPSLLLDKLYKKMENHKLELIWLVKKRHIVSLYCYIDHQW